VTGVQTCALPISERPRPDPVAAILQPVQQAGAQERTCKPEDRALVEAGSLRDLGKGQRPVRRRECVEHSDGAVQRRYPLAWIGFAPAPWTVGGIHFFSQSLESLCKVVVPHAGRSV